MDRAFAHGLPGCPGWSMTVGGANLQTLLHWRNVVDFSQKIWELLGGYLLSIGQVDALIQPQ